MENITTEKLILSNLYKNSDYASKVIPYIKEEYFQDKLYREIFSQIKAHVTTYNNLPNKSIAIVDTINNPKLNEMESDEAVKIVSEVFAFDEPNDYDWLLKESEDFCKNRALYLSVMKCINVYDGSDKKTNPNSLPDLMRDAIAISFDTQVGVDYFNDVEARFNFYTKESTKIKFAIQELNDCCSGGVQTRTLQVIMSGVNQGKSLCLTSLASDYLKDGHDVLYLSLEMRDFEICRRIDANLLDIPINKLKDVDHDNFVNKVNLLKLNTVGNLKVKEYAPGSISCLAIRKLLSELKIKQNFKPKIIMVDYLALLISDRVTNTSNSHFLLKSISEELRAVAVDEDCVIWSAVQMSRDSQRNPNDAELTDVAEGIGIMNTVDMALLFARSETMDEIGQVMIKQLKNRYNNKSINNKFNLNVDFEKQKLTGCDEYTQPVNGFKQKVQTKTSEKFSNLKI